jgi:Trp operon repressor
VLVSVIPLPVAQEKNTLRFSGRGFKSFVKVTPSHENRNEAVLKEGIKLFMSNMNRSDIISMLQIVANGLPDKEFQRTVQRAEMYALSKK